MARTCSSTASWEGEMRKYIEDCILTYLQKRCDHPGQMVAVDILEGGGRDVEVAYCRRCGAVKTNYSKEWRLPMPHLWRGHKKPLKLHFTNAWLKAKIEQDGDAEP